MTEKEPATGDAPPTPDTSIHQLDAGTIQRIAAGEVVERPASVVKELLENSLDAGATRISVGVDAGGKDGIRVRDNGRGIPEAELPLAVTEHATSKIRDIEDLEAGVGSLGFRGEALSTIGAVSELTVRSRAREAGVGAELTVEGGEIGAVRPAGCPEGTTIEVERLFFNTPARKKFLKRESTEFDHINTVVSQYALANPDVAVSLEHNGRELFATEGSGSLRSAVLSVYGRAVAESMIDVEYTAGEGEPIESISGLVSHPETTRSTREYLATFVNGRYVTAATLRGAVVDGYGGQLAPDRYPFAVLFIEVPPASVDVNVHPRKTEVRFDEESAVERTLRETVESTLIDNGLIRSSAPRGRSAPDETIVSPEQRNSEVVGGAGTDHERASGVRSESQRKQSQPAARSAVDGSSTVDSTQAEEAAETPQGETSATDRTAVSDETTATGSMTAESTSTQSESLESAESPPGNGSDTAVDDPDDTTTSEAATPVDPTAETSWAVDGLGSDSQQSATAATPTERSSATKPTDERDPTNKPQSAWPTPQSHAETTQRTLGGGETSDRRQYDQLPTLRVLGQLYETYLLAAADTGLVLIDQHAADERVNYERLQRAVAESPSTQALAEPVSLELTAREAALFDDHADGLETIGFQADREGSRTVSVTAVPAVFSTTLDAELLRDVLLGFVETADGGERTVEETVDELLADLACYPSITGNTSLTEGSVVDLLAALDDCQNPYACPHGRPVIIEISREEIGDRFERDYPGHVGRRSEE